MKRESVARHDCSSRLDTKLLDQKQIPSPVVPYRLENGKKVYVAPKKLRHVCAAIVHEVAMKGGAPIEWSKPDPDDAYDLDDEEGGEEPPEAKRRRLR